jgi:hypothetical protein
MMKKLKLAFPVLLIAALAAFLAVGCKLDETVTASDCMKDFAADLNAGNFDLGKYTHSEATNHQEAQTATFWSNEFEGDGTFTYEMDGNNATGHEHGVTYYFTLEEDGKDNYAIRTITRGGTTIFN